MLGNVDGLDACVGPPSTGSSLDQQHVRRRCGAACLRSARGRRRRARWQRSGAGSARSARCGADLPDAACDVATQFGHRLLQQPLPAAARAGLDVGAGLHDAQVGLAQRQQHAVRLHRAGKVDQLTFAVGEVGLAESRADQHYARLCRRRACPYALLKAFAAPMPSSSAAASPSSACAPARLA